MGPILRTAFHDFDCAPAEAIKCGIIGTADAERWTFFSGEQSQEIKDFPCSLPANISRVIVHCDYGVSRSPGVARYVAEALRSQLERTITTGYNEYIYSVLKTGRTGRKQ